MNRIISFLLAIPLLAISASGCTNSSNGGLVDYHFFQSSKENQQCSKGIFLNNISKSLLEEQQFPYVKITVETNDSFDLSYFYNYDLFPGEKKFSYISDLNYQSKFYNNIFFFPIDFSYPHDSSWLTDLVYREISAPLYFLKLLLKGYSDGSLIYKEHMVEFRNLFLGNYQETSKSEILQYHCNGYICFSDDFLPSDMKIVVSENNKEFEYSFAYYSFQDITIRDGVIDASTFGSIFTLYANRMHRMNKVHFIATGRGKVLNLDTYTEEFVDVEVNIYEKIDGSDPSLTAFDSPRTSYYMEPTYSPSQFYNSDIRQMINLKPGSFFNSWFCIIGLYQRTGKLPGLAIRNSKLVYTLYAYNRTFEYVINDDGLIIESSCIETKNDQNEENIEYKAKFIYM